MNLRNLKMTDEQIDKMLQMHRYLIECELNLLIAKINKEPKTAVLQEAFNDTEWENFAKWFKMLKEE